MRTVKYTRWPAATVLVAFLLFAAAHGSGIANRTSQGGGKGSRLSGTERRQSIGTAGVEDIRALFSEAEQLRAEGKFRLAADTYRRVIAREPYHREAMFWTATCLAEAGDTARLEAYMEDMASGDARLAVELFQRRELAPYMSSSRMSTLLEQARDQARD